MKVIDSPSCLEPSGSFSQPESRPAVMKKLVCITIHLASFVPGYTSDPTCIRQTQITEHERSSANAVAMALKTVTVTLKTLQPFTDLLIGSQPHLLNLSLLLLSLCFLSPYDSGRYLSQPQINLLSLFWWLTSK